MVTDCQRDAPYREAGRRGVRIVSADCDDFSGVLPESGSAVVEVVEGFRHGSCHGLSNF